MIKAPDPSVHLSEFDHDPKQKQWNQLVEFCKIGMGLKTQTDIEPMIEGENDLFLRLISYHRIHPLVARYLTIYEKSGLPVASYFSQKVRQKEKKLVFQNLNNFKQLAHLQEQFSKEGIKALFYKGGLFAYQVFGDISMREFTDLDVLISQKDLPKVEAVLLDKGYQPEYPIPVHFREKIMRNLYEYNYDFYENGVRIFHVEPHWSVGPRWHQLDFSFSDFTPFINQEKVYGKIRNVLSPEGLLLMTIIHHGGQDGWKNLKQVVDLAAILGKFENQLDWKIIEEYGRKWRIENLIWVGLGLVKEVFDSYSLFSDKLRQKKIQRYVQFHLRQLQNIKAIDEPNGKEIFQHFCYQFKLRKSYWTKLKIVWYHLIKIISPNENDIDFSQPTQPYWRLFPQKMVRLWRKKST